MVTKISDILSAARGAVAGVTTHADLDAVRAKFLGPNGVLRELMKSIADLPKGDRPAAGQAVNACKSEMEEIFREKFDFIESRDVSTLLGGRIDPTLSEACAAEIFCHPLTGVKNRVLEIFSKLGFCAVDGPEIETEWFCFDALNTPQSHPSRDDRDTFYFDGTLSVGNVSKRNSERLMLRTHTSTVQVRTMLRQKPPIRILSQGRVFRKDAIDATHSPNFHQCEGLVVDENVTVCDLKSTLDFFFAELTGGECEIRMRPSFFPFVSPGFEVDFRSGNLGKLSNRWIEAAGCGMVAPSVFGNCGYDAAAVSGFAFGVGIERLAMLLFGVDDIRLFFQNDTRFLRQFPMAMF
jgi:phenylalanyl-tRNA synthetase alpha chain